MYDVNVQIGADTYQEALTSVLLTPTTPKATFKGLGKNVHTFVGTPTWVAGLTFAQDFTSAVSLHKTLHTADPGTELELKLTPVAGGETVTVTILTEPGAMGGDLETVPTAAVSLGVKGQPVRSVA
jgi:hypothetical protein